MALTTAKGDAMTNPNQPTPPPGVPGQPQASQPSWQQAAPAGYPPASVGAPQAYPPSPVAGGNSGYPAAQQPTAGHPAMPGQWAPGPAGQPPVGHPTGAPAPGYAAPGAYPQQPGTAPAGYGQAPAAYGQPQPGFGQPQATAAAAPQLNFVRAEAPKLPPLSSNGMIGALLMLFGAVVCVISTLLVWNYDLDIVDAPGGGITFAEGEAWNGWQQAMVNVEAGRGTGPMMLTSLVLAVLAAVVVIAIAALALLGRKAQASSVGLIAAWTGFAASGLMVFGYLGLGATESMQIGVWLYGISFLPALVGAFMLRSAGRPAQPATV